MIRTFLAAVVLAAPVASAQVAPATPAPSPPAAPASAQRVPGVASPNGSAPQTPATPPPTVPAAHVPATKPAPAELHAQAYAFMREDKFDKATPLLNRAYNETPPQQRSRPLILNRALLDLVQKTNPLRGIKDLYQHFARFPAPDEQASNLLGSLLDLAAQNPKWRDGPIYADGFREFARREVVLERHRQGYKRWGHRWITQQEFDGIKQKDKDLADQIMALGETITRLTTSQTTLGEQYRNAASLAQGMARHYHVQRPNEIRIGPQNCARCKALYEATQSATELSAEMQSVNVELQRAIKTQEQLKSRLVKPQWPRRYDPIDPNAPPPLPPQNPGLAAAAAGVGADAGAVEGAPAQGTDPAMAMPRGLGATPVTPAADAPTATPTPAPTPQPADPTATPPASTTAQPGGIDPTKRGGP